MTKIENVYVITCGDYSDYHICAVTLDKKRAEKLKKLYDGGSWHKARIETYTLNEAVELFKYGVTFKAESGKFLRFCADQYVNMYEVGLVDDYSDYEEVTIWVEAKDEEHALKIAQDKLAEYKAKKEGVC